MISSLTCRINLYNYSLWSVAKMFCSSIVCMNWRFQNLIAIYRAWRFEHSVFQSWIAMVSSFCSGFGRCKALWIYCTMFESRVLFCLSLFFKQLIDRVSLLLARARVFFHSKLRHIPYIVCLFFLSNAFLSLLIMIDSSVNLFHSMSFENFCWLIHNWWWQWMYFSLFQIRSSKIRIVAWTNGSNRGLKGL